MAINFIADKTRSGTVESNSIRNILTILQALAKEEGLSVFLVGGALRDWILNRAVVDLDFVVDKKVGCLASRFAQLTGGRCFSLDEERGVYRVMIKHLGWSFDFSLCAEGCLQRDLSLRDFTVNAMALSLDDITCPRFEEEIIDPWGGMRDVQHRILRPTSPEVFKLDPLRIIRGVRFATKYGWVFSPEVVSLVESAKPLISGVASERIIDELTSILNLGDAYKGVALLDKELQCMEDFFPEVALMKGVLQGPYHNLDVWEHCLETLRHFEDNLRKLDQLFPTYVPQITSYLNSQLVIGRPISSLLKLACLFHDLGKSEVIREIGGKLSFIGHEQAGSRQIREFGRRIRLSKKEVDLVGKLVEAHMRPLSLIKSQGLTQKAVHQFFRDLDVHGVGILLIALADKQSTGGPLSSEEFLNRFRQVIGDMFDLYFADDSPLFPSPLVSPQELQEQFSLSPGPLYKIILTDLIEQQVDGTIQNRQEAELWIQKSYLNRDKI